MLQDTLTRSYFRALNNVFINREFFSEAVERARVVHESRVGSGSTRPFRVLHVGDSLHHDILGAHNVGIDSLMITGHGVHREALYAPMRQTLTAAGVPEDILASARPDTTPCPKQALLSNTIALCDEEGLSRPTYIIEDFIW